jgi:hypothetical protein
VTFQPGEIGRLLRPLEEPHRTLAFWIAVSPVSALEVQDLIACAQWNANSARSTLPAGTIKQLGPAQSFLVGDCSDGVSSGAHPLL